MARRRPTARPGLASLVGQARRSFWLLFGGIWLLSGSILVITGLGMAWEERAWGDAIRTTGTVLTKDLIRADEDSGTEYRVGFRFTTVDGGVVRGERAVDVEVWEHLVEQDDIDVWYLPGQPGEARLSPEGEGPGILLFLLLGGGVAAVGGALVAHDVRRLQRARRLLRDGVEVIANVSGVRPANLTINGQPQVRLTYTYRDHRGIGHRGESGYLGRDEADEWPVGSRAAIVIDRDRPSESLWLGRVPAEDVADVPDADPPPPAPAMPPASP